jgi:hypothetical protein
MNNFYSTSVNVMKKTEIDEKRKVLSKDIFEGIINNL